MGSLEDALLGAYEAPDEIPDIPEEAFKDPAARQQVFHRFRIQNAQQAVWALRKIAKIRQLKAEAQALAEAEIAKIQQWLEQELARLDKEERWFTSLLHVYHLDVLDKDPNCKTIRLPGGVLSLRAQQPEFIRNNNVLLAWLKESGLTDFVRVTEEPDWASLKKHVEARGGMAVFVKTGEVVGGVTVRPRPPQFRVTIEGIDKHAATDSSD